MFCVKIIILVPCVFVWTEFIKAHKKKLQKNKKMICK